MCSLVVRSVDRVNYLLELASTVTGLRVVLLSRGWSDSRSGRFILVEVDPVPSGKEDGWAPGPVWTL
jgi:hypothetical protein